MIYSHEQYKTVNYAVCTAKFKEDGRQHVFQSCFNSGKLLHVTEV